LDLWQRIVIPEISHEIFEVPGVSTSDVLEEKLVLVWRIPESCSPKRDTIEDRVQIFIHIVVHGIVHIVAVAIENTGQRFLVSEGIKVDLGTMVLLAMDVAIVRVNYAHHNL
jgi:hypothetical protein